MVATATANCVNRNLWRKCEKRNRKDLAGLTSDVILQGRALSTLGPHHTVLGCAQDCQCRHQCSRCSPKFDPRSGCFIVWNSKFSLHSCGDIFGWEHTFLLLFGSLKAPRGLLAVSGHFLMLFITFFRHLFKRCGLSLTLLFFTHEWAASSWRIFSARHCCPIVKRSSSSGLFVSCLTGSISINLHWGIRSPNRAENGQSSHSVLPNLGDWWHWWIQLGKKQKDHYYNSFWPCDGHKTHCATVNAHGNLIY